MKREPTLPRRTSIPAYIQKEFWNDVIDEVASTAEGTIPLVLEAGEKVARELNRYRAGCRRAGLSHQVAMIPVQPGTTYPYGAILITWPR